MKKICYGILNVLELLFLGKAIAPEGFSFKVNDEITLTKIFTCHSNTVLAPISNRETEKGTLLKSIDVGETIDVSNGEYQFRVITGRIIRITETKRGDYIIKTRSSKYLLKKVN